MSHWIQKGPRPDNRRDATEGPADAHDDAFYHSSSFIACNVRIVPMTVNDSERIAEAADELIRVLAVAAASSQVYLSTIGNEGVEALKQLSIQTASVKDAVQSLNKSQDAKTKTMIQSMANVEQRLANVEGHLKTLNESIAAQTKNQALAWAASNTTLNSFMYYIKPSNGSNYVDKRRSSALVPDILLGFRKNEGKYIHNCSLTPYLGQSEEAITKGEKDFREALVRQIHGLIGQQPRIALYNGCWAIFYS